jgi:hypothetical protein
MNPSAHTGPRRETTLLVDLLALAVLSAAAGGFFWRVIFAGEWMPAGGGDMASFLYPSYHFAAETLKSGTIPFWNPYLWGGAPFVADIQSSVFYPLNLAYFLLSPEVTYRGLMGLAIFHFWLAGVGTYLCVKYAILPKTSAADSPWTTTIASLFAAIAFMFSDFFIVHFGNLNLIAQVAWLPFIFLFFHRAMLKQRIDLALWAGVLLAIAATAGHLQPLLYFLILLALDVLFQITIRIWHPNAAPLSRARQFWQPIYVFLVTTLVGLGLSAFVLLPAYAMTQSTARTAIDYAQASRYSLAPAQLVGLVIPSFFGRDPAAAWGGWDRVEVGYLGILPLILAAFTLLTKRDKDTDFLTLLALVSLAAAMGGYTILHGWLYEAVPGLSGMRAPARIVFLLDFALAGLAAVGLHRIIAHPDDVRPVLGHLLRAAPWIVGAVVLFVLPLSYHAVLTSQDKDPTLYARTAAAANGAVFFAILLTASTLLLVARYRRRLSPLLFGAAAVALLFFDLASLGSSVDVGSKDPTDSFDHPGIMHYLKADSDLYRIDTRTDIWHLWQPDTSLLHEIFDVAGVVNPLTLVDYETFLNGLPDRTSPLYDFLNAKYIIAAKDVTLDWDKFVPVYDQAPQLNVYLNRQAMPRAVFVHDAISAASQEAAFAALQEPDFNPRTSVVIEGEVESVQAMHAQTQSPIQITTYKSNQIEIIVKAAAPGYLVMSEVWHPGWTAEVDGAPAQILRANYAFRAIALNSGHHTVSMTFQPSRWKEGGAISALTATIVVLWLLIIMFRRRQSVL